jgi:hypothetical protein
MEVLSGVSSALAVISLAIEVGDRIKKLCDFWDSIQEAPQNIRTIAKDLSIISTVLEDIRDEARSARPFSKALSASFAALEQCQESLGLLQSLVQEVEPGFESERKRVRKWSAFKAVWKGDRIRKFRQELLDVKMTLILARQNSIRYGRTS